jgi:hypothetical protein
MLKRRNNKYNNPMLEAAKLNTVRPLPAMLRLATTYWNPLLQLQLDYPSGFFGLFCLATLVDQSFLGLCNG